MKIIRRINFDINLDFFYEDINIHLNTFKILLKENKKIKLLKSDYDFIKVRKIDNIKYIISFKIELIDLTDFLN